MIALLCDIKAQSIAPFVAQYCALILDTVTVTEAQ